MKLWDYYEGLYPAWHLSIVGGLLVVVAGLINRYMPAKRPHLRRALTLFLLYALSVVLDSVPSLGVSKWTGVGHELLESFTLVNLGALVIFDVALPTLGIELAAITTDLLLGGAYTMTAFAVLTSSGVEISSVMAGTTVAAAILTVSLQATLGNVLGGITVQIDGSVHMGEWIRLENGREGKVATIGWRSTVLETRDGDSIVVPNATLLGSAFTILGKRDGRAHPHRMAVNFHVDFRWGPADVCRVVVDALRASPIPNVATDPPPDAVCLDLGRDGRDSMGIYAVRFWLVDVRSDDATASIVRGRIHAALKRAGIPLARPSVTYFNIPTDEETEQARLERRKLRAMATMRQLSLFQVLTESELERVAEQLQFVPFAAGETITRQGATAHYLYILQQGAVEVRINANGDERLVAAMQAPTFFGEIALMTGEPRHASVYATTDVVCFRLEKGVLDTLIHERPAIAEGMSSAIADRSTQLQTVRDDLDANARRVREANERERILQGIRGFFGLDA